MVGVLIGFSLGYMHPAADLLHVVRSKVFRVRSNFLPGEGEGIYTPAEGDGEGVPALLPLRGMPEGLFLLLL